TARMTSSPRSYARSSRFATAKQPPDHAVSCEGCSTTETNGPPTAAVRARRLARRRVASRRPDEPVLAQLAEPVLEVQELEELEQPADLGNDEAIDLDP